MPQALRLGLKRFAHVVSPGIFGQSSATEMVAHVGQQFETRLFQGLALAQAGLREA